MESSSVGTFDVSSSEASADEALDDLSVAFDDLTVALASVSDSSQELCHRY